jgi:HIT zinc finger
VNSIKYTCPRCAIHTCSLPCVRRHKQYAQCSGIRDPAEYRKRSQLATPSSLDQDFNFITSIERHVQRADDEILEKGIYLAPAGLHRSGGPRIKFEAEMRARNIKLIRAPQGLSRCKNNKSSLKGADLSWTVEWLPHDGRRRLQQVIETKTVIESFKSCFGKKGLGQKRKRDSESTFTRPEAPQPSQKNSSQQEENKENSAETPVMDNTNDKPVTPTPAHEPLEALHFYLHRPQTSSKITCLIPIEPTATWKELLTGRTVLEFPTIYVREEVTEALPPPFILERDYLQKHGEDVVVQQQVGPERVEKASQEPANLDPQKLLEMLSKDLQE